MNIVIVGAQSAIAEAVYKKWAKPENSFFLWGTNAEKLLSLSQDLNVRGAGHVYTAVMDAKHLEEHSQVLSESLDKLGAVDLLLLSYGVLSNQSECQQQIDSLADSMTINLLSPIYLLTYFANYFEERKSGSIIVISSVAGDRGRLSNYVYGSAKAGLSAFLQGLRQRLQKSGVYVLTVKPGFVDTPMTKSFKKGFLWASPDKVADLVLEAFEKKKDIIYTPSFWRLIMFLIRSVPESAFKRLRM